MITIIVSLVFTLAVIVVIAAFADGYEIAVGIIFVLIFSSIFIGLDIYFTRMYFNFWKYPELRIDRKGNGPKGVQVQDVDGDQVEDAGTENQQPGQPAVTYLPARQQPESDNQTQAIQTPMPIKADLEAKQPPMQSNFNKEIDQIQDEIEHHEDF